MLKKNHAVLKREMLITIKLPLGTMFGVLGPLKSEQNLLPY